ncbi:hypothetical protein CHRY9293_02691 [Chryseobacterium potabilaquae]|uniref:Uncharacterized protein n=2 Tax=Chryseobacterium potabilaquae TaxID=2675057 RepID=A0A6N4XB31_9FLAO|nr:hypothetical protein CHRY9293_02691 [Chryseobacterium potabilaquae]
MKMKKLLPLMFFGTLMFGQTGINTSSPNATLDITAKNTNGSTPEGVIAPRLTGNTLFAAIALNTYGIAQQGAIVYVTEAATLANRIGQTVEVDSVGYYYFDSDQNLWHKLGGGNNFYNSDGTLSDPRQVTMDGNNLGFIGGRIGMGTNTPNPSAILDLTSTTLGFSPPRMTRVQMDAISGPSNGLVIFCIDCFGVNKGCLMINDSVDPTIPNWGSLCSTNIPTGIIDNIQCVNASTTGALHAGILASGVTTTVPYTGGHSGTYFSSSFNSTGVTGLVAHLRDGTIVDGNGTLVFDITGTPSAAGTASFNITVGGQSCTFTIDVDAFTASVVSIDCGTAVFSPAAIIQGQPYTGTLTIPYTGGNGDPYPQQQFTQNGLTFTLPAGTLATGNGNFVYTVTGTATNVTTMSILISFGSVSCNVSKAVTTGGGGSIVTMCMGSGATKNWLAHNLGANTSLDPNTLVKDIHGNYYQWGRNNVVADADTPAGVISGWNTTSASNGSWNSGTEDIPVKTAIDPCPSGFRVPTRQEWVSIFNNTNPSTIGTFVNDPTNFGSGIQLTCPGNGNKLTLPAAGARNRVAGALVERGSGGYYWSSTERGSGQAYTMYFYSNISPAYYSVRTEGYSVRCISE